jgi:hypothetical protein
MEEENVLRLQAAELSVVWLPALFMTVRRACRTPIHHFAMNRHE